MKRIKNTININLDKDTPAETITKLYAALKPQKEKFVKRKHLKRKQLDLYLTNEDIEELNARYEVLYKKVKTATDLSEQQVERACEVLLQKYNFEIEELSAQREAEYLTRQAQIKAKNKEEIPWRRSWLWRLIFRPTTNRAQDIIEERAKLEADARFTAMEEALNDRTDKQSADNVNDITKPQSPETVSEASTAPTAPADVVDVTEPLEPAPTSEPSEPPAPPTRKPRSIKHQGT